MIYDIDKKVWSEVEKSKLFDGRALPMMTHGICPPCLEALGLSETTK